MPSKTDFGDLTLYSSSGADTEETFLKFRTDIAGIGSDSNFSKIASILSSHDFYIQNDRRIFDVSLQRVSDNYYESISSEITRYFPYMLIIFDVSDSNTDSVSVNINSLGNLAIKKFDVSGNIVNLESGDLTASSKYLAEYVGEYFILLSRFTAKEILEKLKTVDGTASGLDADLLDGKHGSEYASSLQGEKADSSVQGVKGNGTLIEKDENNVVNVTPSNIGDATSSHSHDNASTSSAGFMSSSDKSKLDGIATGATKNVITNGTANPSGGSNGDVYFKHS